MKVFKKSAIVLCCIAILFALSSCFSDGSSKVVKKFLDSFKNREIESTYKYIADNNEKNVYKQYIESIVNKNQNNAEFNKLNDAMANKIFNMDYKVLESKKIDNKTYEVKVDFSVYDFSKVYEVALNDFLNKSLDFDNLDNLYTTEYIINLFVAHINNIKKIEKQVVVKVVKDKGYKILMDDNFIEVLTGNSIKLVDSIKSTVRGN